MRQSSNLFKIGIVACHLSLVTLLALPSLRSASASPPPTPGDHQIAVDHQIALDPHIALLEQIWLDAWGLDFLPNQSGMTISPIADGVWNVLVSDSGAEENPFVAQGVFIQSGPAQYVASWDQDLLDEAGLLSVDHSYVSGTLVGSTGWTGEIDAMVTEMVAPGENPGDDSVPVQVLTPVTPVDMGGRPDAPDLLLRSFSPGGSSAPRGSSGGGAQQQNPALTPAQCAAIWNLQRAACEAKRISDIDTCGWITAGCFIGCAVICAATNWGYAICLAVCFAACVAYEVGCMNDAKGAYNACIAAADAARMACDPGWTPPAAN